MLTTRSWGVVLEAVCICRNDDSLDFEVAVKIYMVTIAVNNPAVLLSLAKPHLQGGQGLIIQITEAIDRLWEMGAKSICGPQLMKTGRIQLQRIP